MKLNLRQEKGCSVLEVEGNIDVHNLDVLKAGLSKLLQNGRNRIVLSLRAASDLAPEVIRELAILDVFARELSGKIVIASENADLKTKVTTFAKPPVVAILPSVEKAVSYLEDLDALEGDEGGESLAEITAQLEAKTKQVAALEAQIQQADPRELQKLRAENAELRAKVGTLETQLGESVQRMRAPADAEGFLEKFEVLEETVRRMSGERAAAGEAKK